MSFDYFAYGSNLWPPQMRSRCLSAIAVRTAELRGWATAYDKPSTDGSAKLNMRPSEAAVTPGVVYRIDDDEATALAQAEPGYEMASVEIDGQEAVTYIYRGAPANRNPYDWYQAMAIAGARRHGLPWSHLLASADPDPLARSLAPAEPPDLGRMQAILSRNLLESDDRYTLHPGDLAWWIYHDDPRRFDATSYWLEDGRGLVVIESISREISAFTVPGVDRVPLIEWAQNRRLNGSGEVGWVSDSDLEMIGYLRSRGYMPDATYRSYEWRLDDTPIPERVVEPGWDFRAMAGESDADSRRAAAHAAFESTMDHAMHRDRYLGFMRSPVYALDRDLVAVASDGRIGAFMIWWPDPSGIAQIEPFGTHPDFARRGIGRSLMYFGLRRMKESGIRTVRVLTNEPRPATAFYEGIGFSDVGRLRWWKPG